MGAGGGRGGGGKGNIYNYTMIRFNMADLTDLRKTRWDGLFFRILASFQTLGKLNKGNLLVVAKWWAGTYKLSALRRTMSGFRIGIRRPNLVPY